MSWLPLSRLQRFVALRSLCGAGRGRRAWLCVPGQQQHAIAPPGTNQAAAFASVLQTLPRPHSCAGTGPCLRPLLGQMRVRARPSAAGGTAVPLWTCCAWQMCKPWNSISQLSLRLPTPSCLFAPTATRCPPRRLSGWMRARARPRALPACRPASSPARGRSMPWSGRRWRSTAAAGPWVCAGGGLRTGSAAGRPRRWPAGSGSCRQPCPGVCPVGLCVSPCPCQRTGIVRQLWHVNTGKERCWRAHVAAGARVQC